MTETAPSTRLAELDALRGIAAMLVLLFHYTWRGVYVLPEVRLIPQGLSWGHYGVQLFFAISGFVIFMTLERTRNAMDFCISRFARLFPAYWIAIVLTSTGLALFGTQSLMQPASVALINLSMLQGFLYLPSIDGVYWSLTVELAFYTFMFALWRIGQLNRIETVLLGWIALKLLWAAVPDLPTRIGLLLVVQYIPWFAIGIAAYRVRNGLRSWLQQLPVLMMGLAAVGLADGVANAGVFLAVTAVFAALNVGRLKFLDNPLLLWLGGLSYPLYLVHQNLGYSLMVALERSGVSVWAALACTIAAALATAQAIHSLVELPTLSLIRGWWKNRGTPATA